jgi:predicted site-specific integrase-resolvase
MHTISLLPQLTSGINQGNRTNRVRAAIYARVSTSDGRQEVENSRLDR